MQSFYFGNVAGSALGFWFFSAIVTALGMNIYGLLAYPSWRRPQYRDWKVSKSTASIIAVVPTMLLLTLVHMNFWGSFYQLDVLPQKILLHYFYPGHTIEVPNADIEKVLRGFAVKGQGCYLSIYTKTGKKYRSARVNRRQFQAYLPKLRKILPIR